MQFEMKPKIKVAEIAVEINKFIFSGRSQNRILTQILCDSGLHNLGIKLSLNKY